MKVLIACEFSGIVRDAFTDFGHDAWSCDILETERPGNHIQGDVLEILDYGWDLMVAHPPCTRLAVSGARWFDKYREEQDQAIDFFMALVNAPIHRIAVENPISIMSSRYRKPDQIVQPWQFGHGETKATCWWLKNLPPLVPTNPVSGRNTRVHHQSPGPDRWRERSRFLPGMAHAIAAQWGSLKPVTVHKITESIEYGLYISRCLCGWYTQAIYPHQRNQDSMLHRKQVATWENVT